MPQGTGGAALDHALQHALQLIERGGIGRADRHRGVRRLAIHDLPVLLDGFDRMRRGPRALIGDRGIEGREIDHAHRLRSQHERIIANAFAVELGFHRGLADALETVLGRALDPAVEQPGSRQVSGILERASQRGDAEAAVVVVPRRPIVRQPGAARVADGRQRDRLVGNEGIGL